MSGAKESKARDVLIFDTESLEFSSVGELSKMETFTSWNNQSQMVHDNKIMALAAFDNFVSLFSYTKSEGL